MKPFEQIVTEHGSMVLRVCRAVVGQADAEDAWSETFLAALRAYPDLNDAVNVEAWLVTIAHRKAVDITRARARDPVTVAAESLPDRPATTGLPEAWNHDLWTALQELPSKQRQTVAYHYLGGLPHKSIAEITGGTTEAARRAAADGIRTLRRTYAGSLGPRGDTR
ncbi:MULTISPECIES: RNA polymerase sigma factor [Actinoalloteichus]|uniref:RNA polymerase sigma factor, sigma-70 family n=1 Tax=Actinoalloteichus fjordicus TaxID=1612552 RepID=A0AAC9LK36_9PSEU|nr:MULTISPECIES: sigma-70 family RNA polymerase sigma factor [Actinoalloteichus]APU17740.1 RNA polymerase sigma factor, sigma-70 family [Actinoalloteichus fjordicus]APU23818.1 RNA polymerase sigma factor, sigma-70 family [Actinoalloteichus sp. GBA129-24]